MPRSLTAVLLCAAASVTGGCGSSGGSSVAGEGLTLLLDSPPRAVHAGIHLARARGYDRAESTELAIRRPKGGAPASRQLEDGSVDLALMDIHELALARGRGADLVGVMAVVQRPLGAVLARPRIREAAQLRAERIGVTGEAADEAVLIAVARGARLDREELRTTRVSDPVRALLAGRVAAATATGPEERVAARRERPAIREFRADESGAPEYPQLLVVTTRSDLDEQRDAIAATVRALQRGYEEAIADPESAVAAVLDVDPEADREQAAAELAAVTPAFEAGSPGVGLLDPRKLRRWSAWAFEQGILERRVDVARAFDLTVARRSTRG